TFELYRLDREHMRLYPQVRTRVVDVDSGVQAWLERADAVVIDDEMPAPRPIAAALSTAALAVRLAVANEPVGLLVVGTRTESTPYEDGDVSFMQALAGPLAAALVNTLAFEAVEKLNRELEARVAARTGELESMNSELALLNNRKDELVATISHDFRSPLAIIRQNVQTILRDLPRMHKDDVKSFLEGVSRQEDRLTSLCTNLLDLQRLKHKVEPKDPVDVANIARHIVDDLQARARSKRVHLALAVDDGVPAVVRGDADRLGQVLQNLVDNALKFTPADGRIDVRLSKNQAAPSLSPTAHNLLLEVKDSGCGVPVDALPRLFEPFFQVASNAHAGQGSGLGLAIVKAVVDAHGGDVKVTSVEGRGTTFTVLLSGQLPSAGDVGQHRPPAAQSAAE
ncbi:MAG TPA: HAMP domain-containing sensor histidine kinase, partial [Myxococcota bacterium]